MKNKYFMKKIVALLFLCLSYQTIFASSVSLLDLQEPLCGTNAGMGSGTTTVSVGDFKIQTRCTSSGINSIFTIKGTVTPKDDFFKQLSVYKVKGDACTKEEVASTNEQVIGRKSFKEICSSVGSYGMYFIDGKQTENFETFFNSFMKELGSTMPSLDDMITKGMPCDSATTTNEGLPDLGLKKICKNQGSFADYYDINGKLTDYNTFQYQSLDIMSFQMTCGEGSSNTVERNLKKGDIVVVSHKIICDKNKNTTNYFINNKKVTTKEYFLDLLKMYRNTDYKNLSTEIKTSNDDKFTGTLTMTPQKVASCFINIKSFKLLKEGMKNKNVRSVQDRLKELNYLSVVPNGYYGKGTTNAVRAFQKEKKLPVTGTVNLKTLETLNSLCSS